MTSPIERARERAIMKNAASVSCVEHNAAVIDDYNAALAEEGLWPPEEIKRKALEDAARFFDIKGGMWCGQDVARRLRVMLTALNSKEKEYADNDKNSR